MQNNNKYLQETLVLAKTVYEDKNGCTKYNYIVPVRKWNGTKFIAELVLINSTREYEVKEQITVKSNKSPITNEIYFTDYPIAENNENLEEYVKDEELPF